MKILLLETSTECALIAAIEDGKIIFEQKLPNGPELSKTLGSEMEKILTAFAVAYDRVITGVGPGSFTGIRVGASMANALAFGWGVPLFTVSSLSGFGPETVALDGRMGGIYVQKESEVKLLSLTEAAKFLSTQSYIVSPHPEKIIDRVPGLRIEKRELDPMLLVQQAVRATTPLKIHY